MSGTESDQIGCSLERFVEWARAQGWLYRMAPGHLRHLHRFCQRRCVRRLHQVNATLLEEYQRSLLSHRSATTVSGYLNTVRAWWRYLLREGLVSEDATQGLSRLQADYFVPHLYSPQELSCIEQATEARLGQGRDPRQRLSRWTQHAAFGLLRACGLRVSEACQLDVSHYDAQARTLRIEQTKFFKTRHIPLPRSTCAQLTRYLRHRQKLTANRAQSPALFVSKHGRRLGRVTLERHFKQLLCELGLYQPRRRQGRTVFGSTNLHALRHSFAVRTLERWQTEGREVEHLLPLLSGYLGHVQVSYTKHYLHLTPVLRQIASTRFADLMLPRLDYSGSLAEDEDEPEDA